MIDKVSQLGKIKTAAQIADDLDRGNYVGAASKGIGAYAGAVAGAKLGAAFGPLGLLGGAIIGGIVTDLLDDKHD